LSKVIAGTFSILSDLQVQVMAKGVWDFGTKEEVFTQAYKIENSWTIKHYLIEPLTSLLRHRLMSFLCQRLLQVLFQY
jgi:hypothetical protein